MEKHTTRELGGTEATARKRALGAQGEQLAVDYLIELGYQVLDRNWRSSCGELDIIAVDGGTVVAVEVKTRSGTGYGAPLEAITRQKAQRLRWLLLTWAREEQPRMREMRIDAIGIVLRPGERPRIDHLEGIS